RVRGKFFFGLPVIPAPTRVRLKFSRRAALGWWAGNPARIPGSLLPRPPKNFTPKTGCPRILPASLFSSKPAPLTTPCQRQHPRRKKDVGPHPVVPSADAHACRCKPPGGKTGRSHRIERHHDCANRRRDGGPDCCCRGGPDRV